MPLGRDNSSHRAANWETVFMAQRVGTCYQDSDGRRLLPDLEFDLRNVSTQRMNEYEFDVEDMESGDDDRESEMTCGQKVHMPKYNFNQIPQRLVCR